MKHTVLRGETLSAIARRYGANMAAIQQINHITDADHIRIGMVLSIPRERPHDTPPPSAAPPPSTRSVTPPESHAWLESIYDDIDQVVLRLARIWHGLSDETLVPMREKESAETVQQRTPVTLPARDPDSKRARPMPVAPDTPTHSNTHADEVLLKLKARLGNVNPIRIIHKGTTLSRNERKKIVAGIGLCEINKDVFSTHNADGEFAGKFSGVSYAKVVHIGLSYGYIQCSQDSGNLGALLMRMRASDKKSFDDVFNAVVKGIFEENQTRAISVPMANVDLLLRMTTEGLRPDEIKPPYQYIKGSGQAYWLQHRDEVFLKERYNKAHTDKDKDGLSDLPMHEEIRGARVHPISFYAGRVPTDLWGVPWSDAFKLLGDIPRFQDVQLDYGVDTFLNKVLPLCRDNNVRTGKGLAFVGACFLRGASKQTLFKAARKLDKPVPFKTPVDEIETLNAIAAAYDVHTKEWKLYRKARRHAKSAQEKKALHRPSSHIHVGDYYFAEDEGRRAKILLANRFGFLDEDFYNHETYGTGHDK